MTGETPETAAVREGLEETGVILKNIRRVHSGINEYDRWRHLLIADTEGEPCRPKWCFTFVAYGSASSAEVNSGLPDSDRSARSVLTTLL